MKTEIQQNNLLNSNTGFELSWSRQLICVLATIALIPLGPSAAQADQPQMRQAYASWITRFDSAVEQARKSNRPIMLVFSKSDSDGDSKLLAESVFMTHSFARWSTDHVIKVEVDFPRTYELPEFVGNQNRELLARFGKHVGSYPTVLFIDADGNLIGKTGFQGGDVEAWLDSARKAIVKLKAKDLMALRAVFASSRAV